MSKNQRRAFWIIFVSFCIIASLSIYPQGAFDNIDLGGSLILVISYFLVGFFLFKSVKGNPAKFDDWFKG